MGDSVRIHRVNKYKEPVRVEDIHGEFAYKHYIRVLGTNIFGKYIVIVSNKDLGIAYGEKVPLTFDMSGSAKRIIGNGKYRGERVNPVVIKNDNAKILVYEVC